MNYTEKYHLPQWEENDRIMRTDFNEAMAIIEGGMADTATAWATGFYYGSGGTQKVVTGFRPRMLFIHVVNVPTHDLIDHRALSGLFTSNPDSRLVVYENDGFTVYGDDNTLYPQVNRYAQNYGYIAFR